MMTICAEVVPYIEISVANSSNETPWPAMAVARGAMPVIIYLLPLPKILEDCCIAAVELPGLSSSTLYRQFKKKKKRQGRQAGWYA